MTGATGPEQSGPTDPLYVTAHDGHVFTTEIAIPAYLHVGTTTDLDSGRSWRSVLRSVLVRDHHRIYEPVRELIGDAEPFKREVLPDDSFMFGEAELSIYPMPETVPTL